MIAEEDEKMTVAIITLQSCKILSHSSADKHFKPMGLFISPTRYLKQHAHINAAPFINTMPFSV